MRAVRLANVVWAAIAVAACAHEERRPAHEPRTPTERSSVPSVVEAQYVVADPTSVRAAAVTLPLGSPGVFGLVVDKRRVVVGQGAPRVSVDATADPIVGVARIPGRFGGGFLFWTANTLYRSDAFEAALVPVTRVPDSIDTISFAPKSLLVRTHDGERWGLGLPNGERVAVGPLGVSDVQALDDGRALGWSDQGAVFASTDHGAHWTDATVQVKSPPSRVAILGGDLWLFESNAGALRLEVDGHLSRFDTAPPEAAPELRPKDPRWRGSESPLRAAFRTGAAIDEGTALVVDSGDLVRIDVHTGAVLSSVPGRLPPDAQCEAVPTPGDVLFACQPHHPGGSAFVVSRTLEAVPPTIEQTFSSGGHFFASDDGGLAYAGSCQGSAPNAGGVPTVCVRASNGAWEQRDLSGFTVDAGASDLQVARWIPRADGHVVALVLGPHAGIYDPSVTRFAAIADEVRDLVARGASSYPTHPVKSSRLVRYKRVSSSSEIVDASWSFAGGNTLRGWQRHGESLELSEEGKLTVSPYAFDVAFAGPMGLGRSKDGRLYQSADHGSSWTEVGAPPSGVDALDLVSCTSAGCDVGAFYRVGWSLRPPSVEPARTPAPVAPTLRRVRGLELSCRPRGAVASKVLSRTSESPEDLGLGVSRLPVASDHSEWSYVRNTSPRGIVSPIHSFDVNDGDGAPSLRAVFSGFGTSTDGDVIVVAGPNKNAMSLRRSVSYVAPFDPLGKIVRTSIAMSDVVAAGRRAGMTADEILAADFTESGAVVALTSSDATAPSDIAIHNVDHGLLAIVRGERVRVVVRSLQNSANIVSGVILGGAADESAFLEVDASGAEHVFKVGANASASELFDVSPTASETYYPANPDALAVGPKGELAVLRTPSGSEPASSFDPAFLVMQGKPPALLAPWSEVKLADDPACKAEPGGYRASLQIMAPWIRVTTPELRVEDAPMIARVRWTPQRVCLEGFEVKGPNATVRVPTGPASSESTTFATWLVGRGSSFARVGISEGVEWRQDLECSIATTGP